MRFAIQTLILAIGLTSVANAQSSGIDVSKVTAECKGKSGKNFYVFFMMRNQSSVIYPDSAEISHEKDGSGQTKLVFSDLRAQTLGDSMVFDLALRGKSAVTLQVKDVAFAKQTQKPVVAYANAKVSGAHIPNLDEQNAACSVTFKQDKINY